MSTNLTSKEQLIFALLFGDVTDYEVHIDRFCDPSDRSAFRDEIRLAIKKGNKIILDDRIIHKENLTVWKLEIRSTDSTKLLS